MTMQVVEATLTPQDAVWGVESRTSPPLVHSCSQSRNRNRDAFCPWTSQGLWQAVSRLPEH